MNSVLVVCTGNICRSPTGEAVLRAKAQQHQLALQVDSAGIEAFHQGESPDARSAAAAALRGYTFQGMHSRPICLQDYQHFDLILAADRGHLAAMQRQCPVEHLHKLKCFMAVLPHLHQDIADPYYGGSAGFERVLDQIEMAAEAWCQAFAQGKDSQ
nr:low molecular weight protein-tyrosine-phosphatase [Vibrio stylophorae]